eukprot:1435522-Rhodomonas_salina.1
MSSQPVCDTSACQRAHSASGGGRQAEAGRGGNGEKTRETRERRGGREDKGEKTRERWGREEEGGKKGGKGRWSGRGPEARSEEGSCHRTVSTSLPLQSPHSLSPPPSVCPPLHPSPPPPPLSAVHHLLSHLPLCSPLFPLFPFPLPSLFPSPHTPSSTPPTLSP